jgi:hypothetical protein
MRYVLVLVVAAALAAVVGNTATGRARPAAIDCAALGNAVAGVHEGNLTIATHGSVCTVTGTVKGNVTVRDETLAADYTACDALTAINVVGGRIEGNVRAAGGPCAMVWLRDGAEVAGDVIFQAGGNLGFLGDAAGATVHGNVLLGDGFLWSTGASPTNRVDGNVICNGGEPASGVGTGDASDWDGLDGDVDGMIRGHYLGC